MGTLSVDRVRTMVASGNTDSEIGAQFGVNWRTVQSFRALNAIAAAGPRGAHGANRSSREGAFVAVGDAPAPRSPKPITIAEFLLNKKRAVCPVCQLKEPVKSLVLDAKKKGERQADIIEYLKVVHRVSITPREFAGHSSGRHDA